jgi:light-regulated signal transduction histidine kinase (bacteriophytochrome)
MRTRIRWRSNCRTARCRSTGDRTRLAQVLANLLNNAAKYTQPGGHVALRVRREGTQWRIDVQDDGIGIPRDMLARVFDMFTQIDQSIDRAQGGLGIGLTLVRRLVQLHGGEVDVHSEGTCKGSTFTVHLPAHRTPSFPRGSRHFLRKQESTPSIHDQLDPDRPPLAYSARTLRQYGPSMENRRQTAGRVS